MRTIYPEPVAIDYLGGWPRYANTPEEQTVRAAKAADGQAQMTRYMAHMRDAAFCEAARAVASSANVPFDEFIFFAGSQHGAYPGPYDIADTPEKMLMYWLEEHPASAEAPAQPSVAKSIEREAKRQSQQDYANQYSLYVAACQERKARHAAARAACQDRVADAEAEYTRVTQLAALARGEAIAAARQERDVVLNEPAPVPPLRPL